jgi:hypothetical protein
MKKNTQVIQNDSVPVAVYNTAVPECIAIFRNRTDLAKYLMCPGNNRPEVMCQNILNSINRKATIRPATTKLGLKLALRNANKEQLEILGNKEVVVIADYIPAVKFNEMLSFHTTRAFLAIDHTTRGGAPVSAAHRKGRGVSTVSGSVGWRDTNPLSRYDYAQ